MAQVALAWQVPSPELEAANDLVHVSPDDVGFTRRAAGRGFRYFDWDGRPVTDPILLARLKALVIPPAWRKVWICPTPNGHLQAMGYDEKGRRQYIYHPRFRALRDAAKFNHLITFAEALPALRERIAADMRRPARSRRAVLAAVVHLLETTMIRVGSAEYARRNGSFGLTTLRRKHVTVEGAELRFQFKGKSGKQWRLSIRDRRVANILRALNELPGQHLFQYLDEAGERQAVASTDVNAYLKAATGENITAKDFRTWNGTVLAVNALMAEEAGESPTARKRALNRAISQVAARLGNTVSVCRECYIHPAVGEAWLSEGLVLDAGAALPGLEPEEAAVLAFLRCRMAGAKASA